MSKVGRKLGISIVLVILFAVCLSVTTYAVLVTVASVRNNNFVTGTVKLNLNDGKPVIEESEFLFEPGMTVFKPFTLANEGSCDVYYRFRFDEVEGKLAEVLEVKLMKGEQVLFNGKMTDLIGTDAPGYEDILRWQETKEFTIWFHFPREIGNEAQNQYLSFNLVADGVQVRNNVYRVFN